MYDLLPSNATPQERALAEAIARISDVPVIVREVWNPDTAPASVLPWLAWAFSVDDWDTTWTDEQKRATIKNSIEAQRIKGTIGAVKRQLSAIGIDIRIVEWFNQTPNGEPYTFNVYITTSQTELTQDGMRKIMRIIETNKNLRSHITKIQVTADSDANVFFGAVTGTGSEIHLTNYTRVVAALNDYVLPQFNINLGA